MKTAKEILDSHSTMDWPFGMPYSDIIDAMEEYANQSREEGSGKLPLSDYWKQRCLLAEKCLEESPCDTDITTEQIEAWNAYHNFIRLNGNNH